ncbi:histidine kinase [Nonomuraea sp. KM88]|uniref:histidine kinase n=1 Tax=Nonomuraea sp. KM88 TaxID=3457427 RepID=UPI003FCE8441
MAMARPRAGLPEVRDVLVAAVLAVVVTTRLAFVLDDARRAGLPGWAFGVSHLLALADLATIAFRRSHAVPALVAATVIPLVSMLLPTRSALIGVGVLICSYTVASRLPQVRATVVVSACAAGHMLGGLLLSAAGADHGGLLTFWGVARGDVPGMVAAVTAAYLLPATLGFSVRSRRAAKTREAARIAGEQEERARAAVAEERARIARELHDIAAHDLSAIVVQAGAADRLLDRDPAAVRATLRAIRAQGRDTLVSMRALVGIMRESETGKDLDSALASPRAGRCLGASCCSSSEPSSPISARVCFTTSASRWSSSSWQWLSARTSVGRSPDRAGRARWEGLRGRGAELVAGTTPRATACEMRPEMRISRVHDRRLRRIGHIAIIRL